jgi:uroporphyrin-III C-methyltransferase/precorrin-2 dehydrogenase/sirohydrochlorin ferrochelatase
MRYLPLFIDIRGRDCLVVGGGEVAARKVALLLRAGGSVTVVAPALCPTLAETVKAQGITQVPEPFAPAHLQGRWLAVAAVGDSCVNAAVAEAAALLGVPVNVVDDLALCTFLFPSVVDRSPVVVAVSTGGASPVLARVLRARLETLIPAAYGRMATIMANFRAEVQARLPQGAARRRFWERMLQGPVAEQIYAGHEQAAIASLRRALAAADHADLARGEVYLVGAGPGDPDLLTFRALRLMQQADVVVYDRLVAPALLDLVRRDAARLYVGKEKGSHTLAQGEINETLVRLAREGKRVLRLKGGDPFLFGRGGEEIDTLAANGIPFQIVPGITAATGCAAYAGIPLTHRDYAQSCLFVTGHLKDGGVRLDWEAVCRPRQTVVIYMGVEGLGKLCAGMVAHGLPAEWPAAVVEKGTLPEQRVLVGTLASLPGQAAAGLSSPALVIVGEVVRLQERLSWFVPLDEGDHSP